MTFQKYNTANNAITLLDLPITELSNTLTLKGAFARFPTENFIIKITQYDVNGDVEFRENMLISNRTGWVCNIQTRKFEPVPQDDSALTSVQESYAFDADSVVEVVASSEFYKDIQDEVERLEGDKLNITAFNSSLRNNLTNWLLFYTNGSGDETGLAFWSAGRVLQSNWPSTAPSWEVPTVSITPLTEDETWNIENDFFIKNNGAGANTKIKMIRYRATDAEATAWVVTDKFVTPKQARDNYFWLTIWTPSDNIQASSDTLVQTSGTFLNKYKSIRIRTNLSGNTRVSFDIRSIWWSWVAPRLRRNWVDIESFSTITSTTFTTITRDISYTPWDEIEVWASQSATWNQWEIRNFRLSFDIQRVWFTQVIL